MRDVVEGCGARFMLTENPTFLSAASASFHSLSYQGFLRYLKHAKIPVSEFVFPVNKIANVQSQLEKLVEKNYYLHKSAKDGYRSYMQAYASHSHKVWVGCIVIFPPNACLQFLIGGWPGWFLYFSAHAQCAIIGSTMNMLSADRVPNGS